MSESRQFFGTDGIRGRANRHPMTCETALMLGRAVTQYFKKEHQEPLIVIGKDTRLSCYMFEHAFSAGVCSQGGKAIFTGPLPTPAVAFVTQSMRADAGVMISASHNAYYDNGIKIFDRNGYKLPDNVELELENMILNPELLNQTGDNELGRARRLDEVIGRYIVHAKSCFSNEFNLEGLKIVVDCAHGAAYKVGPMIFEELGAEVITLGANPNGRNINDNCGALHPQNCAKAVVENKANLGFCFDGDADRLIIIDDKGEILQGDLLIGLLAKFLKDRNHLGAANEVVGTVMSNLGLENYLTKNDIKFTRTKVGDRYLIERMRASGALFGGENSGHLIFGEYATTGDAIIAALKVIECAYYYKDKLKNIIADIELYPQILKNVKVKKKIPFKDSKEIQRAINEIETEFDGNGRVLLRYSGTENLARVMIEGKDKKLVEEKCQQLAKLVEKILN